MKRRTALGLLQGLVGKSLGEAEVALQRLTIYWNAGEMPVRWSEYVNYKLPGGKRLIGLSLSPAPTGMERVLAPMNNQYLVVVRDEQNANHSPLFPVGSWTDDPAGVWAKVDEVLRTQLVTPRCATSSRPGRRAERSPTGRLTWTSATASGSRPRTVLRRPRLWTCGGTSSPRGRTGHPTSGAP